MPQASWCAMSSAAAVFGYPALPNRSRTRGAKTSTDGVFTTPHFTMQARTGFRTSLLAAKFLTLPRTCEISGVVESINLLPFTTLRLRQGVFSQASGTELKLTIVVAQSKVCTAAKRPKWLLMIIVFMPLEHVHAGNVCTCTKHVAAKPTDHMCYGKAGMGTSRGHPVPPMSCRVSPPAMVHAVIASYPKSQAKYSPRPK